MWIEDQNDYVYTIMSFKGNRTGAAAMDLYVCQGRADRGERVGVRPW